MSTYLPLDPSNLRFNANDPVSIECKSVECKSREGQENLGTFPEMLLIGMDSGLNVPYRLAEVYASMNYRMLKLKQENESNSDKAEADIEDQVEAEKNIQSAIMDSKLAHGSVPFSSVQNEADMVNHPPHYQAENGMEVIEVISAFTSDLIGIEAVCQGNAIKYLLRWFKKGGIEDLDKCKWYIDKLIDIEATKGE